MNVLVTGAAGFLGSHFCDRLLQAGHRVIGVDNFVTGRPANLAHLARDDRFRMHQADVSSPMDLPADLPPPDAIVHMASPASPIDFGPLAVQIMRVNSEGTYHLLNLARKLGCRFLLTSTSEVYGDPEVHPQTEDYLGHVNPIGPRAVYDESKRYAEAMVAAYRRQFAVDGRIVRIFNTYGPRMRPDDGRVLPAFISAALAGQPLPVQGDGRQTRSFCYVGDTADGIYRLLMLSPQELEVGEKCGMRNAECGIKEASEASKIRNPKSEIRLGPPCPVNVGNPDEVTMLQLAEEVIAATGSRSTIKFLPMPPDDPKRRCPDITRAKGLLGWSPQVPRAEGLPRTIEYFKTTESRP